MPTSNSEISAGRRDVVHLLASVRKLIEAEPGVLLDYAEVVDADTLEPAMALRKMVRAPKRSAIQPLAGMKIASARR